MTKTRVLSFSILMVMVLFLYFACGPSPEANLDAKLAQVDSVLFKAAKSSLSNKDSLINVQKEMAVKFTKKLQPARIAENDLYTASRLFYKAEKYDLAIETMERMDLSAADLEKLQALFQLYIENNYVDKADSLFFTNIKPKNPKALDNYYYYLYYGYAETGNSEKALQIVNEAITVLDPVTANDFTLEKADLLFTIGQKDDAFKLLSQLKLQKDIDDSFNKNITAKENLFNLIGSQAPELQIEKWIDSEPVTMSSLRGKVVLLDFWAPWCGPCRAIFPHLQKLYTEFHSSGLEIIGVTSYYGRFNQMGQNFTNIDKATELEWIEKFKRFHKIPFPYAIFDKTVNPENSMNYGVYGIPHMVLIDKKGIVRIYAIGSGKSSEDKLENGIKELLAETE